MQEDISNVTLVCFNGSLRQLRAQGERRRSGSTEGEQFYPIYHYTPLALSLSKGQMIKLHTAKSPSLS